MVFIISEIVTWNGSGDSVSPNEKLAWDLGKKSLISSSIKAVCVYLGRKPSYTQVTLAKFSTKPVKCTAERLYIALMC